MAAEWQVLERDQMIVQNDKELVTYMVSAHADRLYRYAYWLTHHPASAEDLVQDCFLRAFEKVGQLRDRENCYAWLAIILKHQFLRNKAKADKEAGAGDMSLFFDGCSSDIGPDDVLTCQQALEQMPQIYREPVLLQMIDGLSLSEIGLRLGLCSQTVATRLFRARRLLRSMMQN